MHHKTRFGEALEHLCHKGLRAFFCVFIRAQNLFEERLKKVSSLNDVGGLCVHIAVHGSLDIRMTGNRLQGFQICSQACRIGKIAMTENVRCCSVKVDCSLDSFHTSAVGHAGNGFGVSDDETFLLNRLQMDLEHAVEWNVTLFFCRHWSTDKWLIFGVDYCSI